MGCTTNNYLFFLTKQVKQEKKAKTTNSKLSLGLFLPQVCSVVLKWVFKGGADHLPMSLIPGSRLYIVVNQLDIEMYFTQTIRLLGYTRDVYGR